MTHKGSGWEKLVDALMQIPEIDFFNAQYGYHHPDDLKKLHDKHHRKNDSLAIWCDVVLHNKDFTFKSLCNHSEFIYWISPYQEAESELLSLYEPKQARLYYDFRMEGLRQYMKRTPWADVNPSTDIDSLLIAISRRENHLVCNKLFA